ncbi:unnamed protein product [Nesidiocoris tenuis]|uniref:Uncharacterized protein n=1 Tax=Nesidiocoris tenuis TaxID=355587 RepID=A0A6H5GF46_9HEMI|nr:unnamed protein product [Nesidiocoris tenuis]
MSRHPAINTNTYTRTRVELRHIYLAGVSEFSRRSGLSFTLPPCVANEGSPVKFHKSARSEWARSGRAASSSRRQQPATPVMRRDGRGQGRRSRCPAFHLSHSPAAVCAPREDGPPRRRVRSSHYRVSNFRDTFVTMEAHFLGAKKRLKMAKVGIKKKYLSETGSGINSPLARALSTRRASSIKLNGIHEA